MNKRKIVDWAFDKYMMLKPTEHGWERYGKRYEKKGVINYIINESIRTDFDLTELDTTVQEEFRSYMKGDR